jgi:predicted dehydrogenase
MNESNHSTRRDFLQQAGGGVLLGGLFAALPANLARALMAGTRAEPAHDRVRIGCIGVGGQGKANMGRVIKQVVAVCDVDSKHLAEAQGRVEKATGKKCAGYGDYRKLLDSKDVDAVIVSTPDHWHALPTAHACAAGKDVYCEKPLTLTIAEGQVLVKAARKHKRIVQTGSQQRSEYGGKFRLACELVRSGRIGKVQTVRVGIPGVNFKGPAVPDSAPPPELDYDFWLGPAPKRPYNAKRVHYLFRFFWDYSGGQMTNFGAHDLDITQWALGMDESGPVSIKGKARYHPKRWYEVPEWFEVVYKYASGVTVICGQGRKGGVTFEGDRGSIHVDRGRLTSKPAGIVKEPLGKEDVHLYKADNHHRNWLECIKTRKLPICDVAIGHRSATVCHLGNIAIRTGRAITWDPVKEEIVGDREAAAMVSRPYRAPWKLPSL